MTTMSQVIAKMWLLHVPRYIKVMFLLFNVLYTNINLIIEKWRRRLWDVEVILAKLAWVFSDMTLMELLSEAASSASDSSNCRFFVFAEEASPVKRH